MRRLYDKAVMPCRVPRNVLIPAIGVCHEGVDSAALCLSAPTITGRVPSGSRTVTKWCRVQPHFYKDDDEELRRAEEIFSNVRLHEVYENYAIAFRSYFNVKDYSNSRGVEILNATPGSFIDAFPSGMRLADSFRPAADL